MAERPFWQRVALADMTGAQWESLCDGCGKCCLHKLEDEDSGELFYTSVACEYLDGDSCRCRDYPARLENVPDCINLSASEPEAFEWLPATCAYRLLAEGGDLPEWHPLVSGRQESVHEAGISVRGLCISETGVHSHELEDYIVHWIV